MIWIITKHTCKIQFITSWAFDSIVLHMLMMQGRTHQKSAWSILWGRGDQFYVANKASSRIPIAADGWFEGQSISCIADRILHLCILLAPCLKDLSFLYCSNVLKDNLWFESSTSYMCLLMVAMFAKFGNLGSTRSDQVPWSSECNVFSSGLSLVLAWSACT